MDDGDDPLKWERMYYGPTSGDGELSLELTDRQ